MYRWTFRLFSRTGTSLEKFIMPTNETQHQTSLWVSWQKSPWNPREMSYLDLIGGKRTLRKSGQAKGEEQRPYTLPWTKFHVDCYFSSFCDMCQKFPSFVRWKRQCKQNVQIEIPDKTLEKTSTFCWRPLRLWYLFQFITSSSKTHSGPHLAFFWRFSNFFLQTDRFRVDFFL